MFRPFNLVVFSSLLWGLVSLTSVAQTGKQNPPSGLSSNAKEAVDLAKAGHCKEALPLLKKTAVHVPDKDLKRDVGFAGVRCAMFAEQPEAAIDFLRSLNREFPGDPDV